MTQGRSEGFSKLQEYAEPEQLPFRQVEIIGSGAVGVVEEVTGAIAPFLNQTFARKTITLVQNPQDREVELRELNNEVAILRKVQHEHIVRLVMAYSFRNNYAIVMDPRADRDLEQHLQTANSPLGDPALKAQGQTLRWFKCLISGLAYIHDQGIRHRDIKPSNILLKGDNVLFADFGISKMGLGATVPTTAPTTKSRIPRGRTPEYCAPEVELGHTRGRSADIFSLGAVFLEMLTVYSNPGRLEEFRNRLQVGDIRRSYAKNRERVLQWIESLEGVRYQAPWYPKMLFLCQKLLQEDRYQRPKAGDLCLWWLQQSPAAMPPVLCKCSPLSDNPEHESPRTINEDLRKAYRSGYRLMIEHFSKKGAKLSGNDALIAASEGGLRDIVQILLDKMTNIEARDSTRRTPLSWAAEKGREATILLLLDRGASIETSDSSGRTPLSWAAEKGQEATVGLLLDRRANIEAKDKFERTALSWAAGKGQETTVWLLLDKKADIEAKDHLGLTPLSWASGQGQEAIVRLLLEKFANVEARDTFGRTPLSWAAEKGQEVIVRLLREKKARIEARDTLGRTPLSWAAAEGQDVTVRLLLELGAEIETKDGSDRTPLSWAAGRGREQTVQLLLDKKADIKAKDSSGWTPLIWAAEENHLGTAKLLLAQEKLDVKDELGRTPLSWAAEKGLQATTKLLLDEKADIDAKDTNGRTPLSWAAGRGREAIVKLLLERKAKPDFKDSFRRTPLSWAAEEGREATVKVLLDDGVNKELRDKEGWTPLTRAAKKGHEGVVMLLLDKGAEIEKRAWLDWPPSKE